MDDVIIHMEETAILATEVEDILGMDMGLDIMDMGVTHTMIPHTIMGMDLMDIFKIFTN